MRFDFSDLRLLVHIVEAGSITAGAGRAHLALAAASARIRGMEEVLGMPLLIRGRRGITPTPSGRAVLRHARLVLRQMEKMNEELADFSGGVKGNIRVMCGTAAMTELLPAAMVGFLAQHPGIDIDIKEGLTPDIVQALLSDAVDIGIVGGPVSVSGIDVMPFREDRLVAITPRGHALGRRRYACFADLLSHDFVGLTDHGTLQLTLASHAAQLGRQMRLRVRVHSFDAICQLVEGGVGIAVLPESAALRYRHAHLLRRINLRDEWASRTWHICVRRLEDLPAYAQDLVAGLRIGSPTGAPESRRVEAGMAGKSREKRERTQRYLR
ncbi:MAG: LysR substrate-binding domain-containing protein [Pseudomonadota bacterium]